ncbi:putative G2/mitotic-specific cyclin cdc13 [Rhizoctonia solani 123E]|uniref:Putative G2/mitotic-specific cyclin cdc13 n=1 Tax=Rhizoctonia solani 123E TaxID=1423351 RepID=A0A074SWX9_9AGAM|nr:putative G2/mitotic-specific cyclin cdc13 [Rhizoctonia solani 123E]
MSSTMDIGPKAKESELVFHKSNTSAPLDATKLNLAVLCAIEEYKAKDSDAFKGDYWLDFDDTLVLLQFVLSVFQDRQVDKAGCLIHLTQHPLLSKKLTEAYTNQKFDKLLDDPDMPPKPIKLSMGSSSSVPNLKSAFEEPYKGGTARLFVKSLNKIRCSYVGRSATERPYNWSIAVLQASGMGKSRMVDESSFSMFTIPINVRGGPPMGKKVYPPSDISVCGFFDNYENKSDDEQQAAYAIFLQVLFTKTLQLVQIRFPGLTGQDLARAWAMYLKVGESEDTVGVNRQELYNSVVCEANDLFKKTKEPTLDRVKKSLRKSCSNLERHVQATKSALTNSCFLYFDEAHSLACNVPNPPPGRERSAYHNLGTVLSKLTDNTVFFIFLSTNPRLQGFAPAAANYPSHRVTANSQLIPPFTELAFDLYEHEVLKNRSLTLQNVCKTEVMVGFGRVLWYTELKLRPCDNIFDFAVDKLATIRMPYDQNDSSLAALGVRLGITFNKTNPASHPVESRLVESHSRVIYAIHEHRHFMHTGSPSEPILAEAASKYLNRAGVPSIGTEGPNVLSLELEQGVIARGERGELAGRLLLTCAHDLALKDVNTLDCSYVRYHRPLRVVDFLRALFHEDHHELILKALPVIDRSVLGERDAVCLCDAFSESFVSFSHFVIAEDPEMLSAPALATALVRGMAIQARDEQTSIDAVIPIHMGPLTAPISSKTTSAINLQFKNRKTTVDCHVNRSTTVPDLDMPVISIVFELGVTETMSNPIHITSKPPRIPRDQNRTLHRDDRHYQIVVHGCNSRVFGVIPPEVEEKYRSILGTGSILHDFARNKYEENREALLAMKPAFSGKRQKELYSDLLDLETE